MIPDILSVTILNTNHASITQLDEVVQDPAKHLWWSLFYKIVNGF